MFLCTMKSFVIVSCVARKEERMGKMERSNEGRGETKREQKKRKDTQWK